MPLPYFYRSLLLLSRQTEVEEEQAGLGGKSGVDRLLDQVGQTPVLFLLIRLHFGTISDYAHHHRAARLCQRVI
jgi:hypothetical protein